jgi:hypothetical protein
MLAVALAGTACSTSSGDGMADVAVRDSAGVEIVTNLRAQWTDAERWRLSDTPVVSIGDAATNPDADAEDFLLAVRGPQRLADGRLVLVELSSYQFRLYDSTGVESARAGGRGEGPGELSGSIGQLYRCAGDTLLIARPRTLMVFTADGAFVREHPLRRGAEGWGISAKAVSADCRSLLLQEDGRDMPDGSFPRAPARLLWQSLATEERNVVHTFGARQGVRATYLGYENFFLRPWSSIPRYAVSGEDLVFGAGEQAEYEVRNRDGDLVRVVRWSAPPEPVTAADRELFGERRETFIERNPEEAGSIPPLDLLSPPERKPLFTSVVVDDSGNVWVREYSADDSGYSFAWFAGEAQEDVAWWVFTPEGHLLGTVSTPPGLRVSHITGDMVLGVHFDADEVETVQGYRLIKPGT